MSFLNQHRDDFSMSKITFRLWLKIFLSKFVIEADYTSSTPVIVTNSVQLRRGRRTSRRFAISSIPFQDTAIIEHAIRIFLPQPTTTPSFFIQALLFE